MSRSRGEAGRGVSEYGVWGREVDLWRALGEREQRALRGKVRGCWEGEAKIPEAESRRSWGGRAGVPDRPNSLGAVRQETCSWDCLTINHEARVCPGQGPPHRGSATPRPPSHLAPALRYRPEPSPGRVLGQNRGFPVAASGGRSPRSLPTRGSERNPNPASTVLDEQGRGPGQAQLLEHLNPEHVLTGLSCPWPCPA